ncbi:NAD(P)/FAD-dependent oxidoreductase [Rhodoligotrophos ferricapiens]|uniref:NAD(P)/FAD-dependent oxidoreductase n=1 Tax=Rhodoligotrophos ferricapiens TaxID=3069264 RepID=UPI00315D130B
MANVRAQNSIFHPDFRERVYWWGDWQPEQQAPEELPARADVVIIGAGYCGISAALELVKSRMRVVVLDAQALGAGASTMNGGQVSGIGGIAKIVADAGFTSDEETRSRFLTEAMESFTFAEHLIERLGNPCAYVRTGRFTAAWTPEHFARLEQRAIFLNRYCGTPIELVPRSRQREEVGSDLYFGGTVTDAAGLVQPAQLYRALLAELRKTSTVISSATPAQEIERSGTAWRVVTPKGTITAEEVIIATNGYTVAGNPLSRQIVPIASHMIATEELPTDVAAELIPKRRGVGDTPRVLTYYRLSPDGRRMLFGGRPRFTRTSTRKSAELLHEIMVLRFPQIKSVRVTHAWNGLLGFTFDGLPHVGRKDGLSFALGCNGSGIAMMLYLGHVAARQIIDSTAPASIFASRNFAPLPLYRGKPWFLPVLGTTYRALDRIDRLKAAVTA